MSERSGEVLVLRPARLRRWVALFTSALLVATALGWLALPVEVRELFSLSQILTLLGVLAFLVVSMVALGSSYVRADASGLVIRNAFRRHTVPWSRVHKILLRRNDSWGLLLMTPADGRPFVADIDAEKCQMMGIQRGDGDRARAAVDALRERHRHYLEAS